LPGVCSAVLWFCDVFVPGAACRAALLSRVCDKVVFSDAFDAEAWSEMSCAHGLAVGVYSACLLRLVSYSGVGCAQGLIIGLCGVVCLVVSYALCMFFHHRKVSCGRVCRVLVCVACWWRSCLVQLSHFPVPPMEG